MHKRCVPLRQPVSLFWTPLRGLVLPRHQRALLWPWYLRCALTHLLLQRRMGWHWMLRAPLRLAKLLGPWCLPRLAADVAHVQLHATLCGLQVRHNLRERHMGQQHMYLRSLLPRRWLQSRVQRRWTLQFR